MFRRTKIISTLGPATDDIAVLDRCLDAGLDVARLNFSHGSADNHRRRAAALRKIAARKKMWVGLLVDLQGPKIRIEKFHNGKVQLEEGALFILDPQCPQTLGDRKRVGLTYKDLAADLNPGDTLLLDDGRIVLKVDQIDSGQIISRVEIGGELSDGKGINRLGGGLSARALTDKDKNDIRLAAELDADYMAVSFPRSAEDMIAARKLLEENGGRARLIAKIERAEALEVIEEIIEASDAVMIARGDLGVEIGDAALPPVQKEIIRQTRSMNKVVITATQMMESMIKNRMPTRAEVFDVANAVFDGTDAVMLSEETALGSYPDQAIRAMARICVEAEKQKVALTSGHRIHSRFHRIDEAISMATMYVANHLKIKAIAALTESGSTPLWMSRISSGIPIYALTPHAAVKRRVALYRGVYPADFTIDSHDHAKVNKEAVDELQRRGVVAEGDLVLITKGDLTGVQGGTNALKIAKVGAMATGSEK